MCKVPDGIKCHIEPVAKLAVDGCDCKAGTPYPTDEDSAYEAVTALLDDTENDAVVANDALTESAPGAHDADTANDEVVANDEVNA